MKLSSDIVSLNEGELQIRFLADYLASQLGSIAESDNHFSVDPLTLPGGLNLLSSSGSICSSGPTSQPLDFEFDLSSYYKQIDIVNYYKYGNLSAFSNLIKSHTGKAQPSAAVQTKRGCRANCAFCTVRTFNGKGLRLRDLSSVINELRFLYQEGIRHIEWLDDDLLWDPEYNKKLFSTIRDEFPELIHTASNGLIGVAITPELMQIMSDSGLIAFKIGVESGSSNVIKDIRKPTTLWRLLDKSILISKFPHIFFSANFIIGFWETFLR